MEQHTPVKNNRIARDLTAWKRIEDKLSERYGRKIVYDRNFLKAKSDIYNHIRNKHKTKSLNLFEKAEMRILQGQQRSLLRQIYPNSFIRLTRNALVFAGNSTAILLRAIVRAGNTFLTPQSANSSPTGNTRSYTHDPQTGRYKSLEESRQQTRNEITLNNAKTVKQQQKTKEAVSEAKTIFRKLPLKNRMRMPATQHKGVRR